VTGSRANLLLSQFRRLIKPLPTAKMFTSNFKSVRLSQFYNERAPTLFCPCTCDYMPICRLRAEPAALGYSGLLASRSLVLCSARHFDAYCASLTEWEKHHCQLIASLRFPLRSGISKGRESKKKRNAIIHTCSNQILVSETVIEIVSFFMSNIRDLGNIAAASSRNIHCRFIFRLLTSF
jgi:hypothetical protein